MIFKFIFKDDESKDDLNVLVGSQSNIMWGGADKVMSSFISLKG